MKKHKLLYYLNHSVNTKYALSKYTQMAKYHPNLGKKKNCLSKGFPCYSD